MPVKLNTAAAIAQRAIIQYLRAPKPDLMPRFMFWGKPGMGKSAVINELAEAVRAALPDKARDFRVETVILANYDAADFGGVTWIDNGVTRKIKPFWFPTEGTTGVLFLDELPAAAQMNQNIVAQLVCERRIGEFKLPVGWSIIAAGNRRTDRAGTSEMPMHVRNRFAHFDVEEDFSSWVQNFAKQPGPDGQPNITSETIGYLTTRPANFCKFDPTKNTNSWPSPRSWTYADQIFRLGLSEKEERIAIAAFLGDDIAAERMEFRRLANRMPKPAHIYADPVGTAIPADQPDVMDALLNVLQERLSYSNLKPTCIYVARLPREIGLKFTNAVAAKNPEMTKSKDFIDLLAKVQMKAA